MMYIERLAQQLSSSTQALVKQFKQHISSKRIPTYQEDQESNKGGASTDLTITLGAILYQDFLSQQETTEQDIQPLRENIKKVIGMLEGHPLQKVLNNEIPEETKQKLLEQQLAREQQRSETNRQKTTASIQKFLQKSLHQLKRAATKHPRLSKEQKNEIMHL